MYFGNKKFRQEGKVYSSRIDLDKAKIHPLKRKILSGNKASGVESLILEKENLASDHSMPNPPSGIHNKLLTNYEKRLPVRLIIHDKTDKQQHYKYLGAYAVKTIAEDRISFSKDTFTDRLRKRWKVLHLPTLVYIALCLLICNFLYAAVINPFLNIYFSPIISVVVLYIGVACSLYFLLLRKRFAFSAFGNEKAGFHPCITIFITVFLSIVSYVVAEKALINPINISSVDEIENTNNHAEYYTIDHYDYNYNEAYTSISATERRPARGTPDIYVVAKTICPIDSDMETKESDQRPKVFAVLRLSESLSTRSSQEQVNFTKQTLARACRLTLKENLDSGSVAYFEAPDKWRRKMYVPLLERKYGSIPRHIFLVPSMDTPEEAALLESKLFIKGLLIYLIIMAFQVYLPRVDQEYITAYEMDAEKKWWQLLR